MLRNRQSRTQPAVEETSVWIEFFAEAVVLMDSGARVLVRNRAADRLFQRSGIVSVAGDHLRVACNGNQERLEKLLARAIDSHNVSCQLRVRRVENGEALCLNARRTEPGPRVLLFLSDGFVEIGPTMRQRMRELWNLSAVEARVAAAVVEGTDLKTYAREHGVSPHTVRTQLNTVFAKTGAGRQADLVRLVLTGPGYLAEGSHEAD